MMKLKFLNFWYRSAKRFSLLLIVSSIMISGLYAQNMSRNITLTVTKDSLIGIDLFADAVNTSIKIVSGTWDTTIIVGKFWTGYINYPSHDTVMTIYGNVNKFKCSDNQTKIAGIDVSQNTALTELNCSYNQLTSLDVSKNVALCTLYCWNNQLTSLDVSGCTALTNLQCYRNQLTSLNVSGCAALTKLDCERNQLTSLDVSTCASLKTLYCYSNQLTSLNVSGCTALTDLLCYSNQLTSLNVSGCTALTDLLCYSNQLTSLDLSDCIALTILTCYGNNFSTQAYNDIMCFLPSRSSNNKGNFFPLSDANDANSAIFVLANASIATAKNWNVVYVYPSNTSIITTGIDTCNPIMNRYITLNVAKDSLIEIRLATDAANSPVRIVSGDSVYNFTTTSTSLTNATSYRAEANTMTIYGDVKTFYCNNNKTKVIGINLSKNTALTELDCSYNQLTSLDLSKNTALTELNCRNNQLTSLDLTACTALTTLYCLFNQLTSLDVSKNVALCTLSCYSNQLTSLDVSKNTALTYLSCYSNQLTSLDVSTCISLKTLYCDRNQLTSIDVSKNTALTSLSCVTNQLTSLDVSGCTALTNLSCYSNQLTSLDLSKNTALTSLSCVTNQLTSLDLSKNTALTELSCYDNLLTSLNVSGCTALNNLYCENNQLTSLDVSPNTALTRLRCYGNNFSTKAYNDIMCFLPSRSSIDNAKFFPLYDATDTNATKFFAANASIATAKNWNVVYYSDYTSITTTGAAICNPNGGGSSGPVNMSRYITLTVTKDSLISIRLATDTAVTPIRIVSGDSVYDFVTTSTSLISGTYYARDSTMTIYGDVKIFYCNSNQTKITGIDVSKNTALTELYCNGNQLTSLNVSGCTALTNLQCNNNQLTSLDVSGCTALTNLQCYNNQLTSLNVSGCSALTYLLCNENQLTSLDVSGCTALTTLYCFRNPFSTKAYNDIMCFLPSRSSSDDAEFFPLLYADDANSAIFVLANASIATAKNWSVYCFDYTSIITTGAAICDPNGGGSIEPVNMSRYITLNVTKDSLIEISLATDTANTPIRIVSGDSVYDFTASLTSLTSMTSYYAGANTMTIYGDVKYFWCENNQTKITGIDASNNTTLIELGCYNNALTSLDVSKNTALGNLYCGSNQLTSLDVSGCTALTELDCEINQLTSLDVSKNTALTYFYCNENQLTSLNVSGCASLKTLFCNSNQLTSLDVSKNTALEILWSMDNQLTSLDISKNTALTYLDCGTNQLTSLDISKNTALTNLQCYSNQLTSLDVSKNTSLYTLSCYDNQLTSLDLSQNTALTYLECYENNFSTKAYNDIMCFLPSRSSSDNAEFFPLYNTTDTNATKFVAANASIATAKNWNVVYYSDYTSITTTGNDSCLSNGSGSSGPVNMSRYITLNVTKNSLIEISLATDAANTPIRIVSGDSVYDILVTSTSLTTTTTYYAGDSTMTIYGDVKSFYCYDNKTKITGIDVSKNVALCTLYCYDNNISALDVSKNTALTYLSCYSNQLTSLDVSTCTSLKTLYCDRNQLTSLDVSKNTALTYFYCYGNQLTSLDVSKNTALTYFYCYGNQLTSLDVSKNTALIYLYCYRNNFSTKAYNDIMCSLPSRSSSDNAKFIPLYNTTDTNATKFVAANASIATAKNWNIVYYGANTSIITTGAAICDSNGGGSMEPVNMSRYITLTVTKNSLIEISLATDVANTPIRIVSGDWDTTIIAGTNRTSSISYPSNDTIMTIYGDVKEFACPYNYSTITSLDVSKNTALTYLDGSDLLSLTTLNISGCSALTHLSCFSNNLTTLDVSVCTNLRYLNCCYNNLTTLDVSVCTNLIELYCNNNNLTTLDVSKNTALIHLSCSNNQLTSLDVSKNTALTNLYCHGNNFSTKAYNDIMCSLPSRSSSDNAKFIPLYDATDTNATKFVLANASIATAKNWNIVYYGANNTSITTTGTAICDPNGGGSMEPVNMNRYITLTVTKNSLIEISLATDTANTPIRIVSGDSVYNFTTTSTSVTNVTSYYAGADTMTIYGDVNAFYCNDNKTKITGIDVSKNTALTNLSCGNNQLTSLDLSGCASLKTLYCYDNQLTSLDVSKNTKLQYLQCHNNQLTSLDVSGCAALTDLQCYTNQLTSLDVSGCASLKTLYCYSNQLTSLNVSGCTALNNLYCENNQLTSLDVSKNLALTNLYCFGNPFSTKAYNDIMCSLPSRRSVDNAKFIPLLNANDANSAIFVLANASIATAKNWSVRYSLGSTIMTTTGNDSCLSNGSGSSGPANMSRYITLNVTKDSLIKISFATDAANIPIRIVSGDSVYDILVTSTSETNVTSYYAGADTMTIYGDVNAFYCNDNKTKITGIDASNNVALCTLYCYGNQLTSLDLSDCSALTDLYCDGNALTSLDVSKNLALTNLYCHGNNFSTKAYNDIMCSLPSRSSSDNAKFIPLLNANDANSAIFVLANASIATAKNWNVVYLGPNNTSITTTGAAICDPNGGGSIEPVNMNRYITLNVTKNSLIEISLATDAANTSIRIVSGDSVYDFINANYAYTKYYAGADTMTIYGDVKEFACPYNYSTITGLDVSHNTALTYLDGSDLLSLTTLNISGCSALTFLSCYNNNLTTLDVSGCTSLEYLDCETNNLTTLDVSKNLALTNLYCHGNNFSTKAYNDIMCSLPSRSSSDNAIFIPLYDATDTNATKFVLANASIATAKNWDVRYSVGGGIITTTGTDSCNQGSGHDTIPTVNMSRYITLNVTKDSLIGIDLSADSANTPIKIVSGNWDTTIIAGTNWIGYINYPSNDTIMTIYGDVKSFYCYNNKTKVTEIDVSNNIALCTLYCANNQLTSLDVSNNTALTYLACNTNQLTSLDLSQNTALISLNCHSNQLISLNVRGCTALIELRCYDNDLTSLDLSQNTALISLNCHSNQLTSLDVSNNIALWTLSCYNNQLTSLDLSNNTSLRALYCYGNPFTTAEYDAIMCSLPMKETSDNARYYPLYDANDINATKFVASNSKNAIDKNWNVQYGYNDSAIPSTTGDYDCDGGGGEDPEDTTNVTEIKLSNIEIYPNPAKTMLTIKNATANVQIFDITGREIMHVENKGEALLQINVSHLSKGMYFVKVGNYTTKFVKE